MPATKQNFVHGTNTELEGTWVTSCNTASWSNTEYVIEPITGTGSA